MLSLFLAICGSSPPMYWELLGTAPFDSSLCPSVQDPSKSQPRVVQETLVHVRDTTALIPVQVKSSPEQKDG